MRAVAHLPYQVGAHFALVVFVQRDASRSNPVMLQQCRTVARVFGGDQIHLAQDRLGARGKIVEIADRRGDDPQPPRRVLRHAISVNTCACLLEQLA